VLPFVFTASAAASARVGTSVATTPEEALSTALAHYYYATPNHDAEAASSLALWPQAVSSKAVVRP
jgi:hypothetical protein